MDFILDLIGRFHPLIVHLPIGFIVIGLMSDLFFRKGKTGAWKNELSVDISKKIEKKFKKEMVELGYL